MKLKYFKRKIKALLNFLTNIYTR